MKNLEKTTEQLKCNAPDDIYCGRKVDSEYLPCVLCTEYEGGCDFQRKITLTTRVS